MFGLGPLELTVMTLVVVLLFGSKRISLLLGSLGEGLKNFRQNVKPESDTPSDPTQH